MAFLRGFQNVYFMAWKETSSVDGPAKSCFPVGNRQPVTVSNTSFQSNGIYKGDKPWNPTGDSDFAGLSTGNFIMDIIFSFRQKSSLHRILVKKRDSEFTGNFVVASPWKFRQNHGSKPQTTILWVNLSVLGPVNSCQISWFKCHFVGSAFPPWGIFPWGFWSSNTAHSEMPSENLDVLPPSIGEEFVEAVAAQKDENYQCLGWNQRTAPRWGWMIRVSPGLFKLLSQI